MDKMRNTNIRGTAKVGKLKEELREVRLGYTDVLKEDLEEVVITAEDAAVCSYWRKIHCGDPLMGKAQRRRRRLETFQTQTEFQTHMTLLKKVI